MNRELEVCVLYCLKREAVEVLSDIITFADEPQNIRPEKPRCLAFFIRFFAIFLFSFRLANDVGDGAQLP